MVDYTGPGPRDRHFFKSIVGTIATAAGGFLAGGPAGAGAAVAAKILRQRGGSSPTPGRTIPSLTSATGLPSASCPPGFIQDARGQCIPSIVQPKPGIRGRVERFLPGGETGFIPVEAAEFGEAVMGRYGAGLEPAVEDRMTRICPRGTVLGDDGICYNRRDLRNSERMYPRGRRPLLTGGEMRAISTAASAAKKLDRKKKQLEQMGMLKKSRSRVARRLPSGHHTHTHHD